MLGFFLLLCCLAWGKGLLNIINSIFDNLAYFFKSPAEKEKIKRKRELENRISAPLPISNCDCFCDCHCQCCCNN